MRKLILAMLAVILSFTLSYAESCSLSDGSLSYQISDCSEQSRACCVGVWCDWGTSVCSSCTETSESRNCSGNVSGACAGTQSRTRSVARTCGSCSYSSWGSWSTSGCSYTQSCTATSESRNCSGNVTNACAGTQTRTRTVSGTCGSCSYSSWGSWTGTCSYTQTCSDISKTETETRACSGNVSNACAGTQTRTRTCTRSVSNSCGSCTYGSWSCGVWSDWSGSCSYTQSCTDLSQTVACSTLGGRNGNITETRTVTNDCGSCTYSGWTSSSSCRCGNWDSELLQCCGGSGSLGGRRCGWLNLNGLGECPKSFDCTSATAGQYDGEDCVCSCIEYGGSGSSGGCSNTIDCVGNEENACSGTITSNTITTPWGAEVINIGESTTVTVKNCLYSQSCTDTTESRVCTGNVSGACGGVQTRTRSVSSSCGSCSYGSWSSWSTSGCYYEQTCNDVSKTINCSNVGGTSGTITATRSVNDSCGGCSYGNWVSSQSCSCVSGIWDSVSLTCI